MISRQFVDDSLTVITEVLTRTGHTGTGDQIIWYVGGPGDSHILVEVTKAADAELNINNIQFLWDSHSCSWTWTHRVDIPD